MLLPDLVAIIAIYTGKLLLFSISECIIPCPVGLVVSVSASHTVDRGFASWPGHTKDHHKNGTCTNCLPA